MNGLIRASLRNPYAVTVMVFTILVLGVLCLTQIPFDILPTFKSPAVQVLTFYGGMPAKGIEKDITNRMERWTGQANGIRLQESRSIVGASIVRNYFHDDVDPNGALTQVNSLALAVLPNLPPGTLPSVVLPFDPTSTVPVCLVALDSESEPESILYDVGRYEVRNMIMSNPGASAPVVFGGKLRAVLLYLDRIKMQARGLSPVDVMRAADQYNVFVPSGDVKIGGLDFALMSNSMYEDVDGSKGMGNIPLEARHGNAQYLRDVAQAQDAAFIQTNVVRVNGCRQVYIPVYRQLGASTLKVVDTLKKTMPGMTARLTRSDIDLRLVMDQSIYVRSSIEALAQEGALGSVLCSLVILLFLGEWRMTLIAITTLPLSVLAALVCLYYTGNTVNVMTLGGLALAIGPMVDSAIICLENTHRHLSLGSSPHEAAFLGASEVAMPELVSTLCTFLVLAPLALMPGIGQFLFRPMALAVAFAMVTAYLLSRSLVPAFSALWLKGHSHGGGEDHAPPPRRGLSRLFARWEALIERGIAVYLRGLNAVLNHRLLTVFVAFFAVGGRAGCLRFAPATRLFP
jgi:multidrug efflux pump subunit AcrB